MKRKSKWIVSLGLCMALMLPASLPVCAAEGMPAGIKNVGDQDYTNSNMASVVKSFLCENGMGGVTRIAVYQPSLSAGSIYVEDYDSGYQLVFKRELPMELTKFGGFFSGAENNYVVYGQENRNEDDSTEVIRVVKYSKNWERLGQASERIRRALSLIIRSIKS